MERLNVNLKAPKQAKANNKKKPMKVVYISNPRKVDATPSEFRAVVQELTGQDSDIDDFFEIDATRDASKFPSSSSSATGCFIDVPAADGGPDRNIEGSTDIDGPFDMFDEAFASQMMANYPRFAPTVEHSLPGEGSSLNVEPPGGVSPTNLED